MEKKKEVKQSLFGMQLRNNTKAHELSIALNMVGLTTDIQSCDLILETQKLVHKMKGNFDLITASKLKVANDKKYQQLLNDFNQL